jgi:TRAP-type mannitol/chloroaromatic compound transport system substrate-binding protein
MNRKDFLKIGIGTVGAATIATSCVPEDKQGYITTNDSPNIITNRKYSLKMVTTWPPKFPVFGEVADLYAQWVKEMSNGRIEIKVYGGGEFVPPLEAFDAVSQGSADIGCGGAYYWSGKSPATPFFAAVPFGMNAQQMTSWLMHGGGLELWREVYAKFNLVPFIGGNSGVQMGGWFNREINTIDDFKGLKMRMPGLGGKVIEKAGAAAILIAGSELYTSLERGVIDATEWVGPYHDYKMGFHKISKYYYYPGWHEPGTNLEFFVNKKLHDSLPKDLQMIMDMASYKAHNWVLGRFESKNGEYLSKILTESKVQLKQFPQEVLSSLKAHTKDVINTEIGNDALSNKVYTSYQKFAKQASSWAQLTEKAYYNGVMNS